MKDSIFIQLQALFDKNIKKYRSNTVQAEKKYDKMIWSKSPLYNIYPFENERLGIKLGKELKSEPKIKKNCFAYFFENNLLVRIKEYKSQSDIYTDHFINYKKDKIQILFYDSSFDYEPLVHVAEMFINEGVSDEMYSISYNRNKLYEKYFFNVGRCSKIHLWSYDADIDSVIEHDYVIEYKDGILHQIILKAENGTEVVWK